MIDTDKYEGCRKTAWRCVGQPYTELAEAMAEIHRNGPDSCTPADLELLADAPKLLAEVKRLRGLLDEIDDVVYYNDEKAGQVLPVEKPNLELLRDIMMSYTDEAYQIRGDEGEVIE